MTQTISPTSGRKVRAIPNSRRRKATLVSPGDMPRLIGEVMSLGVGENDIQQLLTALHDDHFSDHPIVGIGSNTGTWFAAYAAMAARDVQLGAIAKVLLDFFGVDR